MFMGPLEAVKPWSTQGVEGCLRFLRRVWRLYVNENGGLTPITDSEPDDNLNRVYHKTVKKVTEDVEELRFNTAIAQMMTFVNEAAKQTALPRNIAEGFLLLLSPFAPHIVEELWQRLGHNETLTYEPWPTYDEKLIQDDMVEIVIQVNGRLRDKLLIPAKSHEDDVKAQALASERVKTEIAGKQIKKVIVVPDKICNIVIA
jgi:leucyl-tRNA synthetase